MNVERTQRLEVIRAAVEREIDVLRGQNNYVAAVGLKRLLADGTDEALLRFGELCVKAASMAERFGVDGVMEVQS